ncbi:MAG: zinc ribbon domain-containing protein [Planctomycetota bacterium]
MPTYDYECQACGHQFELFQSMTASVKRKCPECSKLKLQRLIGPGAGFLFKGDGFYITDYRSDSYKAGEKAAKDGGKKAGSEGDGGKPKDKPADKKKGGKADAAAQTGKSGKSKSSKS